MLDVIDDNGKSRPVTSRLGRAHHWEIYHTACREYPDLVKAMHQAIREAIASDRYLDQGGSIPNSTWLGSEILRTWQRRSEWNSFCGDNQDASSTLFGEIMWTVMYDDERNWCTMKTAKANSDRDERVYFLCAK